MSPIRPQSRTVTEPSSATPRRRGPSPSLRQPPFRPPAVDPAPSGSQLDTESLPHPDALLRRSHGRGLSPARSDGSDDVLDLVARRPRPVATAAALSPLSSPTPSPRLSPPPTEPASAVPPARNHKSPSPAARSSPRPRSPSPDPDPPLPLPAAGGVRALRTRKPTQLRPYSLDQARYKIRLEKNGWEGAVVPLDRSASSARETPEELKRRKELQALRPRNHLGGWLVSDEEYLEDEEGDAKRQGGAGGGVASSHPSSLSMFGESLESEDGLTLLEREARRKERLEKAVAAGMVGNASKRSMSHPPPRVDGWSTYWQTTWQGTLHIDTARPESTRLEHHCEFRSRPSSSSRTSTIPTVAEKNEPLARMLLLLQGARRNAAFRQSRATAASEPRAHRLRHRPLRRLKRRRRKSGMMMMASDNGEGRAINQKSPIGGASRRLYGAYERTASRLRRRRTERARQLPGRRRRNEASPPSRRNPQVHARACQLARRLTRTS